jgi:maltose O-acetyltransferase
MTELSERQKMLSGEEFRPFDAELVTLRKRARRLTRAFNASTEEEMSRRAEILRELFGGLGKRFEIEPPFHCDYGSQIIAGERLFLNFGCVILDCAEVRFGQDVLCGPNVHIYSVTHPLDPVHRARGVESAKPVRIGDRVWIGGGCIICPGITIGDGTTIGAGSVVTRDIPANVFAAGNPCRVIRELPVSD